jgi:hypothetical protein
MTKNEVFAHIARAIAKDKGTWAIGDLGGGKFMLALGAPSAVRIQGGMVLTISVDLEEIRKIREACDEALAGTS